MSRVNGKTVVELDINALSTWKEFKVGTTCLLAISQKILRVRVFILSARARGILR